MITGLNGEVIAYGSDVEPGSSAFNLDLQPVQPNRQISLTATLVPTVVGATDFAPGDTLSATGRELLAINMTNVGYAENYTGTCPRRS